MAVPGKHLPERKRKLSKAQQTNAAMKKHQLCGGVAAGEGKKKKRKTIRRHNLLGQQQRMAGGRAIKTKVPTGMSQVE